jgi:outer membrane protein assembly factor BamB
MSNPIAQPSAGPRRLWIPAVLIAAQLTCLALPYTVEFEDIGMMFGILFLGPMVTSAGVALWWLFLSGLPWLDRLLGLFVVVGAAAAGFFLSDPTFQVALTIYGLSALTTLWVGYLLLTAWLNWPARRVGLVLTMLLAAAGCTLLRLEGTYGNFVLQIGYRFGETSEDRYLKGLAGVKGTASPDAAPVRLAPGDWPGFRGPARDARLTGVTVPTDWENNPPKQLWKQPIGPGWSSFAVVGNRLYTQEQRGPKEVVVCLDAGTGKQVWEHADEARFTEPIAGAGPRATPTFHEGKVYALGAKGTLNCLDAATGKKAWARDIVEDSGSKPQPGGWWGYSSSPLVSRGVVIVVASFTKGKCALGYKADTGDLAWAAGDGKHSYSSAHPITLGGAEQVLVPADGGLTSIDPTTGKVLWQHDWKSPNDMARCTQPAVVAEGDLVLGAGLKEGARRLQLRPSADAWASEEVWTTKAISPYFNDLVVHKGHIYGFDTDFFTCVDVEKGEKRWRARGYGQGQVLLLADQGLLLILSEKGDVALVKADPEKHTVVGRFKAIEGKTWNHPVVAHGRLFVRNGNEAACYQLAPDTSSSESK